MAGALRPGRVLVVDDDDLFQAMLHRLLTQAGHEVRVAADLIEGLAQFEAFDPDLVLLDLGLPSGSGYNVLDRIHATRDIPVLIVSGSGGVENRIAGLERGAVDFITKPFEVRELLARVEAQLRARARPAGRLEFDGLVVDLGTSEVERDGESIHLAPREFALLAELASHPGERYSREQLLAAVWASASDLQDPSTVNVHVRRLRSKLEVDSSHPRWIVTSVGGGYYFSPDLPKTSP